MARVLAAMGGVALGGSTVYVLLQGTVPPPIAMGVVGCIGNTPLIEITSLSEATGCRILGKAEHMNPGGSIKDRAAKWLVLDAERRGVLTRGTSGLVVEGTGGNTGVGLGLVTAALGYRSMFSMPNYISKNKQDLMKLFGAEVVLKPPVAFSNQEHFYHVAKRLGRELPNAVCCDQFENTANAQAHYEGTAPEIYQQTKGKIDGFVCASGTGGTIGGISSYLKERDPSIKVYLIDPPASGLYSYVKTGEFKESKGPAITEGVGIMRKTANFALAKIDGAFQGTNQEALDMTFYLLQHEGLFVGPSAGLNVAGAVKLARELGPGHTIVTILCDTGDRYIDTIFAPGKLQAKGYTVSSMKKGDLSFVK